MSKVMVESRPPPGVYVPPVPDATGDDGAGPSGAVSAGEAQAGAENVGTPSGPSLADTIVFRRATPEDLNFIRKNWLRVTRGAIPARLKSDLFYEEHDRLIGEISKNDPCWVACDREHPFFIYGFACGYLRTDNSLVLHFVLTRDEWRGKGIARALVERLGWDGKSRIDATHWSAFLKDRLLGSKPVQFNPYPLVLERMYVIA